MSANCMRYLASRAAPSSRYARFHVHSAGSAPTGGKVTQLGRGSSGAPVTQRSSLRVLSTGLLAQASRKTATSQQKTIAHKQAEVNDAGQAQAAVPGPRALSPGQGRS